MIHTVALQAKILIFIALLFFHVFFASNSQLQNRFQFKKFKTNPRRKWFFIRVRVRNWFLYFSLEIFSQPSSLSYLDFTVVLRQSQKVRFSHKMSPLYNEVNVKVSPCRYRQKQKNYRNFPPASNLAWKGQGVKF